VACPAPSNIAAAMVVAPSLKVIVPVGVPLLAATIAVKVTLWPNTVLVWDELSVVVVGTLANAELPNHRNKLQSSEKQNLEVMMLIARYKNCEGNSYGLKDSGITLVRSM